MTRAARSITFDEERLSMRLAAIAVTLAVATAAQAAERGMHLCPNAITAESYWIDLNAIHSAGAKVTAEIARSVGAKNGCKLVMSDRIKPIEFRHGAFVLTDGTVTGWAVPDAYIAYVK